MSLRAQLKHFSLQKYPPFYLIYFDEDETVSIIKPGDLVELPDAIQVGSICHVKIKKKVFKGRVITFGSEEEVRNVEDQFLNEIYIPDFLREENTTLNDDTATDPHTHSEGDYHSDKDIDDDNFKAAAPESNEASRKRRRHDSISNDNQVKKKVKKNIKAVKENSKTVKKTINKNKDKKEQLKVVAVSSLLEPELPDTCTNDAVLTPTLPESSEVVNSTGSFEVDENNFTKSPSPLPPSLLLSNSEPDCVTVQSLSKRMDQLEAQFQHLTSQIETLLSNINCYGTMVQRQTSHQPESSLLPAINLIPSGKENLPPSGSVTPPTPWVSQGPTGVQQHFTPTVSPPPPWVSQGPTGVQQNSTPTVSPIQLNSTPHQAPQVPALGTPPHNSIPVPHLPLPQAPANVSYGSVNSLPDLHSNQNSPSLQAPSSSNMLVQPASSSPSAVSLFHPDCVIQKYPKLCTLSNAGRLAVRLAYESYFGKDLIHKSTVYGQKDRPPLPRDRVLQLKNKMLSIHLASVSSQVEFEAVWTKCVNAINHSASALRAKKPLPLSLCNT